MSDSERIGAKKAHDLLSSGEAQLVCAYEDEKKCDDLKLPWAMPFSEFQLKASTLPKDQKLVFY